MSQITNVSFSVPEYAKAIIPGIKDKVVTPQAVIKQINVSRLKQSLANGKKIATKEGRTLKIRAAGLPKRVKAEKFGRFYTLTINKVDKSQIIYNA